MEILCSVRVPKFQPPSLGLMTVACSGSERGSFVRRTTASTAVSVQQFPKLPLQQRGLSTPRRDGFFFQRLHMLFCATKQCFPRYNKLTASYCCSGDKAAQLCLSSGSTHPLFPRRVPITETLKYAVSTTTPSLPQTVYCCYHVTISLECPSLKKTLHLAFSSVIFYFIC
jgi:hypothetical protein